MKRLFTIDLEDYEPSDLHFRRPSARAIIINASGSIALVYSRTHRYFKFPGGGIHEGESITDALIREVREETGLSVIPDTVTEYGSALSLQKSNSAPHTVFEQENYYYRCNVHEQAGAQELDAYEAEDGYELLVTDIGSAIAVNERFISKTDDLFDRVMIERETRVLKLLRDEMKEAL